jgi:hypothetical protein
MTQLQDPPRKKNMVDAEVLGAAATSTLCSLVAHVASEGALQAVCGARALSSSEWEQVRRAMKHHLQRRSATTPTGNGVAKKKKKKETTDTNGGRSHHHRKQGSCRRCRKRTDFDGHLGIFCPHGEYPPPPSLFPPY